MRESLKQKLEQRNFQSSKHVNTLKSAESVKNFVSCVRTPMKKDKSIKPIVISPFSEIRRDLLRGSSESKNFHKKHLKENVKRFDHNETDQFIKQISESLKKQKALMSKALRKEIEVMLMYNIESKKTKKSL